MEIAMRRRTIIAVVLLGAAIAAEPAQAQYRVKPFPSAPPQGYAVSNQNRGTYFNPKDLTINQRPPWQKGQVHQQGGMFFGRGPFQQHQEGGVTGFTRKVIGVRK
jgi:hypothetical protein